MGLAATATDVGGDTVDVGATVVAGGNEATVNGGLVVDVARVETVVVVVVGPTTKEPSGSAVFGGA